MGLRQKPEGNVHSRESDHGQSDGKCVPGEGNSNDRQWGGLGGAPTVSAKSKKPGGSEGQRVVEW